MSEDKNGDQSGAGRELEQGAHGVAAERDTPPVRRIAIIVAIFMVVVVALLVALNTLFRFTVQQEIHSKQLAPVAPELTALRAEETLLLTRYQADDKAAGRYRLPIDRAVELVANDPSLLAPKTDVELPPGSIPQPEGGAAIDAVAASAPTSQAASAPASLPAAQPASAPAEAPTP